jgi:hypothetical protein
MLKKLREQMPVLGELPGADVSSERGALKYHIRDKEEWNAHAVPKLAEAFGETLFREYERGEYAKPGFNATDEFHRERALEQSRVSFNNLDELYIVNKGKEPIGFLALEHYKGDVSCGVIRDIVMKHEHRSGVQAGRLVRMMSENRPLKSLLGYTKNRLAVSLGLTISERSGFKGVFGDMRSDDPAIPELQANALDYMRHEGIIAEDRQQGMPQGYAVMNGELQILPAEVIPPQHMPRVDDPTYGAFETLNELQEGEIAHTNEENAERPPEQQKLPDSVVGIWVARRS